MCVLALKDTFHTPEERHPYFAWSRKDLRNSLLCYLYRSRIPLRDLGILPLKTFTALPRWDQTGRISICNFSLFLLLLLRLRKEWWENDALIYAKILVGNCEELCSLLQMHVANLQQPCHISPTFVKRCATERSRDCVCYSFLVFSLSLFTLLFAAHSPRSPIANFVFQNNYTGVLMMVCEHLDMLHSSMLVL